MDLYNDRHNHLPSVFMTRGRAVVVEPDARDLNFYSGILRGLGFEVKPFANYYEASWCVQTEPADFILVNQGSPSFEARAVVECALARDRRTPVVVLARTLNMGCYLEAMQLGAVDYVEKPLAPAEMEYLVTRHARWPVVITHPLG